MLWDKWFCGELINWNHPLYDKCFRKLGLTCPIYAILTVVSAFYVGQQQRHLCRLRHQLVLIYFRIAITIALLLCPVLYLSWIYLIGSQLYIVDYITSSLKIFCWIIHVGYLCALKTKLTVHTRGPLSVIICFVLCLAVSVLDLRANLYPPGDLKAFRWQLIEKYITISVVVLQVLYCFTLFPRGQEQEWQYEELWSINSVNREREPLISSLSAWYGGFREDTDPYALGTAEEESNFVSKLFFWWIRPLMQKGYKNKLQTTDDLFDLPVTLRATSIDARFSSSMQSITIEEKPKTLEENDSPSERDVVIRNQSLTLLQNLHKCFGLEYYSIGILKLLSDSLAFSGPLLLNMLVLFLEGKLKHKNVYGYYYALGLFGTTILGALLSTHYNYLINKISLKIRAAIITTVYRKALNVSKISLSVFSTGEIVNFMSTDTDRIVNFCQSFHQFWSLPIQIAITLYLLHQQVGFSFLAGLTFAILIIPLNQFLAKKIGIYSKLMMEQKDKRIKLMNEVLSGIRVIKMHAWEDTFCKKVQAIRKQELKFLKKRKYLDAFCVYFWATTPVVISVLTFTTYVLLGNTLTASRIFTSLALFNMLIMPLNAFPWVLNGLMEAWISLKRVQLFLKLPDQHLDKYYSEPKDPEIKLEVCNGVFEWVKPVTENSDDPKSENNSAFSTDGSGENKAFQLGPLNIQLIKGKFLGIIGRVGSGKSTLLSAILADVACKQGTVNISVVDRQQGIGLVPQEPWIQQTSVKDNILFGKTLNTTKYRNVLEACALFDDLKIFPAGDKTEIGDKGLTLSGGQRTRIALARAVYQDVEIYLLDDILSAVDVHVAEHIFSNCITGILKNKTRILCTHHIRFLEKADYVIILNNGEVVTHGPPNHTLPLHFMNTGSGIFEDSGDIQPAKNVSESNVIDGTDADQLVEKEERDTGMVKFHVYKSYWNAVGTSLGVTILIACFFMQGSRTLSDWWLSYWISEISDSQSSNSTQNHTNSSMVYADDEFSATDANNNNMTFYLSVYGALAIANSLFTVVRAFLYAYSGVKAAISIHYRLLKNIIKAPIGFFDITPLGRILNRFSSDVYNIDDTLPFVLNILLAQTYSLVGCLAVTCYGLPWIILLLLPLGALYYNLQRYYRYTSRELKRLSSVTLSPIYAHFSETLNGHSTIRAMASIVRFRRENAEKLDENQQAIFATMAASQWLNLRLQLIGVAVVTGVALIALVQNEYGDVDPGLVGLAMSYALSVTSLLNGTVTSFTETEKEIVSVERAIQYIEGVRTEKVEGLIKPPFAWPTHGVITFQDVWLQYRPRLPFALKNIDFETKPGEKLGIVGRTGSGKTSLIKALFRMVEISQGVICIDGVNIANLCLQELRSHLAVIPQDPFLFSGSVKENLDPEGSHSDAEVWKVLHNCHIGTKIRSLGGLDAEVGERGQSFSTGERQLICLARTLLHKAKILCMDEATASVDHKTDSLIQMTIRMAFRHTTILIIAHRIETVMDCDHVLVMGEGKILELDKPSVLLENTKSHFYKLVYGINCE